MRKLSTQFCHFIDLIYAFACKKVQAVKILIIVWEDDFLLWRRYGDDGLENDALSLLNPLTHRVQVGGEVHGCRIDALPFFSFTLTIELLPPFCKVMEFWMEVN